MVYYNLASQNQSEVVPVYTMTAYGAVAVQLHLLLNSKGVSGQLQFPVDLPAGREAPEIFKLQAKSAEVPVRTSRETENLFSLP